MLRAAFLWLSEQPRIFRFVRKNRLAHKLASRFVAGETIDAAITTLRDLNNFTKSKGPVGGLPPAKDLTSKAGGK